MSDKLKLFLVMVLIAGVGIGGLSLVIILHNKEKQQRIDTVNKHWKFGIGIITKKQKSKSRAVELKYEVNNKIYHYHGTWDLNMDPDELRKGDSIRFRYSIEDPEFIVTELEKEF